MRTKITLAPGETKEMLFVLGQAENLEQVRNLISAYAGRAKEVLTGCNNNGISS